MTTHGSDPAFAQPTYMDAEGVIRSSCERSDQECGMTKREVFVLAVLSGMDLQKSSAGGWTSEDDGKLAVEIADATIAALNAGEKEATDG